MLAKIKTVFPTAGSFPARRPAGQAHLLVGLAIVAITPVAHATTSILIGNGPNVNGEPAHINAQTIADNLTTSNINVYVADNNIDVVDNIDLSYSATYGPTTGNLTFLAETIEIYNNIVMGSGNVALNASFLNLQGKITDGTTGALLGGARLSGTALIANVLGNTASIQQAIDASSTTTTPTIYVASDQYTNSNGSTTLNQETITNTRPDGSVHAVNLNLAAGTVSNVPLIQIPQTVSLAGASTIAMSNGSLGRLLLTGPASANLQNVTLNSPTGTTFGGLVLSHGASATLQNATVNTGAYVGFDGATGSSGVSTLTMSGGSLNAGNSGNYALAVGAGSTATLTNVDVNSTGPTGSLPYALVLGGSLHMTGGSIGDPLSGGYLGLTDGGLGHAAVATLDNVRLDHVAITTYNSSLALYALALGYYDVNGVLQSVSSGSLLPDVVPGRAFELQETLNDGTVSNFSFLFQGNSTFSFYSTSPVPLPASAWMLLSGLGCLGLIAKRKRVLTLPA